DIDVDLVTGDIESVARRVAAGEAEMIVAGGGDGTVSAVAAQTRKAAKPLGILPLGTLNHFSKDLGIPQKVPEAVAVIAEKHVDNVDLGEVNGRIFLNNSSIGLYPKIVRMREQQQQRLGRGKWSAALFAAIQALRRDPFLRVQFEIDGKKFTRKTPFVFIGNNEYGMNIYNIGRRERISEGCLSVCFLQRGGRRGAIMLLIRTIFGLLRPAREVESIRSKA